jgi:hypothetical protein
MSTKLTVPPGPVRFQRALDEMPKMLQSLLAATKVGIKDRLKIPNQAGVYVFSDGELPIYVGQTRKLRNLSLAKTRSIRWSIELRLPVLGQNSI